MPPFDELIDMLTDPEREAVIVQDYRPLAESLEWRLARVWWRRQGPRAFTSGAVPYLVNNDGRLASEAAALLHGAAPPGPVAVLELGAGSGLFAKLVLDAVRERCPELYARLTYVVTDVTRAMLNAIETGPLMRSHGGRVLYAEVDALTPEAALDALPAGRGEGFFAIFANYVLDNLPASLLRAGADGLEELHVRTRLDRAADLRDYTHLDAEAVRARVDAGQWEEIVDIAPALTLDTAWRPLTPAAVACAEDLPGRLPQDRAFLHSHGALRCVRGCVDLLREGGFVLLSDYPASPDSPFYERYGGSMAVGLNFGQLEERLVASQTGWVAPVEDAPPITCRLVGRSLGPGLTEAFRARLGRARYEHLLAPLLEARRLSEQRQPNAARAMYAAALRLQPRNWVVLEEIGAALLRSSGSPEAGYRFAVRGLEVNPSAPSLWNLAGDCLLSVGRLQPAEVAYARALEMDSRDVDARYGLACVRVEQRRLASALTLIAEALVLDRDGGRRERLLAKQREIIGALDERWAKERHRARGRVVSRR